MNGLSLIESILKLPAIHNKSETVRLPAGGLFQGKVLKLFPGQTALVGLGGMKLHARLEAPLVLHQHYLFEVLSNPGIPVLKVIKPLDGQSLSAAGPDEAVLNKLGLRPDSKARALFSRLIAENIPFTKNMLKEASFLLDNTKSSRNTIDVLAGMIRRNMPITPSVFESYQAMVEGKPISQDLGELRTLLASRLPESHPLLAMLKTVPVASDILLGIIKTASGHSALQNEAFNLLAKSGLTKENIEHLIRVSDGFKNIDGSQGSSVLRDLFAQSRASVSPSEATAALQQLLNSGSQSLRASELNLIDSLFLNTVTKSGRFHSAVKEMQQLLGMNHERHAAAGKNFPSIKSALLELINQENISADLRDRLQQTVNRLTGIQLASVQTSTAIEQYTVQVPFQAAGEARDISIHIQGKEKEGGGIDPDYCSMIFAVNLNRLGDVTAGVLVQNRILSITILTEQQLEPLIQKWKPALASGLEEIGYRLSSVKTASIEQQKEAKDETPASLYQAGPNPGRRTGVDFKI
ncbi:hypothetical protein [Bacillus marinisedimentorum]|uniref:hypothetical protein n=1 Tax=Bacillus marinisedimentorum TaxID=1821260 RepID=UPI0007E0B534|nr:hypothetical protein [Bacillus marinisedimentorum]